MEILKFFIKTFLIYIFMKGIDADVDTMQEQRLKNFTIDNTLLPFFEEMTPWFMCKPQSYENTKRFVTFHHYTKNNPEESNEIEINNTETLKNWINGAPVRIIIHGLLHSKYSKSSTLIKRAYLDYVDYNIIVVDWSTIAQSMCYKLSVLKVNDIGKYTAELINFLKNSVSIKSEDIYLIGYSLGAHIAGAAGKYYSTLYSVNNEKISAIFALDPAGPLYRNVTDDEKVDKSDAKYVEIIHTDSHDGFGIDSASGHADFFINGGESQPGCFRIETLNENIPSLWLALFPQWVTRLLNVCSHERSYELFSESVRLSLIYKNSNNASNIGFFGYPCNNVEEALNGKCLNASNKLDSLQRMGGEPYQEKNGIYYVKTSSGPENYALNKP